MTRSQRLDFFDFFDFFLTAFLADDFLVAFFAFLAAFFTAFLPVFFGAFAALATAFAARLTGFGHEPDPRKSVKKCRSNIFGGPFQTGCANCQPMNLIFFGGLQRTCRCSGQ